MVGAFRLGRWAARKDWGGTFSLPLIRNLYATHKLSILFAALHHFPDQKQFAQKIAPAFNGRVTAFP
jgi:hypothetical protein